VAIGLLDLAEPDPDAEPSTWPEAIDARSRDAGLSEDHEPGGDEERAAWIEWHALHPAKKRGPNTTAGEEDDEEDDPSGQCDEDGINTNQAKIGAYAAISGPGCTISDVDKGVEDDRHDEEHDMEREQLHDDVPTLPVVTLEHNLFTDQRQPLGYSNLLTSFQGMAGIMSADSGRVLQHPDRSAGPMPGVPV
jgi:hypothetical protein